MLEAEDFFLQGYLFAELIFGGHVEHVLGLEEVVVVMEYGVSGYILIGIGREYDADGWVVAFASHEFVVHADIHIHLTYVLMADGIGLEIDEDEALEDVVVEDEIDVVVAFLRSDEFLTSHKTETFA